MNKRIAKMAAVGVVFLITTCILMAIPVYASSGDYWVKRAPMPNSEDFVNTAVIDGKIYAIGSNNTANTNYNYLYNPSTDSWASKTPMPTIQMGGAIATCQNKIYMIGGGQGISINFTTSQTGTNEMYDPTTDTWTSKTPMPIGYANLNAVTVNGMIYVMGGTTVTSGKMTIYGKNELYDPTTDSWKSLTPMPIPVVKFGMVAVGNQIYVIGGQTNEPIKYFNQTQIYDIQTNTWSYGTQMPIITIGVVAAVIKSDSSSKIYYIGNEMALKYYQYLNKSDWTYTTNSPTQIYDLQTRNWTTGASSPTTRISGVSLAVVNNTMYAIGGYDGIGQTSANEQYFPVGYQLPNSGPTSSATPSPSIPEFQSRTILLLFSILAATVISSIYLKKRHPKLGDKT
jgi:N-acetylneuraminic acid mutarotase